MSIKKINIAVKILVPLVIGLMAVLLFLIVNIVSETGRLRDFSTEVAYHGNALQYNNDKAIKYIKKFAISHDERLLREHAAVIKKIDDTTATLEGLDLTSSEKAALNSILSMLDKLEKIEDRILDAYHAGEYDTMSELVNGDEYYNLDAEFSTLTVALLEDVAERIEKQVAADISGGIVMLVGVFVFILIVMISMIPLTNWIFRKLFWHEAILDSVPFPISVTNMKREWTFVNKPVETFLGKSREQLAGRQCHEWGANICKTKDCGIECLERGKGYSMFQQNGLDFRVDAAYLTDHMGKKVGHIEIVQDITQMLSMQRKNNELARTVSELSREFVDTTQSIASGAQDIAQGSTEQAASVEELSSTIHEVSQKTHENAQMASQASGLSTEIKQKAEKGSRQMDELMGAVQEITQASSQIERVIKVIDDIAFQTNILALNAAVEAARAGSAGKGFAVVAEEVRNLASKSAEAAKNTSGLIENSITKSKHGMSLALETTSSLNEIVEGINSSADIIGKIARSSEEQSTAIAQINVGIDQVAEVIQRNSATSEESAAASSEMNQQAAKLEELISQFKL